MGGGRAVNRSGVGAYGQITQVHGYIHFPTDRFSKLTKYYPQISNMVNECQIHQKISWFWLNFPEFCPEKHIFHMFCVLKIIYPCSGFEFCPEKHNFYTFCVLKIIYPCTHRQCSQNGPYLGKRSLIETF